MAPTGNNYAKTTTMAESPDLSLQRTLLAEERTLMAWIRTSVSLITFGFTIYKFFQYLKHIAGEIPQRGLLGPREFAVGMITLGVIALVAATVQHRRTLNALDPGQHARVGLLAGKLAVVVAVMGLFLLVSVMLRF
jgi:putative membrane protein